MHAYFDPPPPFFFFQKRIKFGEIDKCPIYSKFSISNTGPFYYSLYTTIIKSSKVLFEKRKTFITDPAIDYVRTLNI
jgi:hypothetical protein